MQHTCGIPTGRETIFTTVRRVSVPGRSVPIMPRTATAERVDRAALLDFLPARHQAVLLTHRRGGGGQHSPVTCGMDAAGHLVVPTCSITGWGPISTGGFPAAGGDKL